MAKLTLLLFINIATSQAFRSLSFCISLHFDNAVNVKEKKSFFTFTTRTSSTSTSRAAI